MIGLRKLPIRPRLTVAFAVVMAALFAAIALALYLTISYALLDGIDSGLLSRAQTIRAQLDRGDLHLVSQERGLIESEEQFAQVVDRNGRVVQSDRGEPGSVLPPSVLKRVTRLTFMERRVSGVLNVSRIVAVPAKDDSKRVLVIGATMQDRSEAMKLVTGFLAVGGPVALALASFAGWRLAGSALSPVERMRQQASAISVSDLDRRLTVPEANDEFRRLATTLNSMLGRLEASIQSERRFLDNASHELRTPLAVLKTELDLALARPRSLDELAAALRSASEETDRLASMAEDLLVLARTHGGLSPVSRKQTSLRALIAASCQLFRGRADAAGVRIGEESPDTSILIDGARVRQAVDNLLDNALRLTPAGGTVSVRGEVRDHIVRIVVEDDGPGFPPGFEREAFEPFRRASSPGNGADTEGTGLGLAIVKAIAESHGGGVTAENRSEGGGRVTIVLKREASGSATFGG